ncbi:MAG: hypothetical protein ACJA14_002904 [Ilumatobacter sp.]|jgi:hypothetical protein
MQATAGLMAVALVVAACGSEGSNGDSTDPISPAPVSSESAVAEGGQCSSGDAASMYRLWNDAALDAIRLDFPAPTVHARNLYHLSAALWDIWRAYEPAESAGLPVFVDAVRTASDVEAARDEALAFAAHRFLTHRYELSLARPETKLALNNTLSSACGVQADFGAQNPASAAAFGVSVADEIIAATIDDGSLEREAYQDAAYRPVNDELVVGDPGANLIDPDRWQPLLLDANVSQNGVPLPGGEQTFIGSNWGSVTPFAIEVGEQPPLDPGAPPRIGDTATADQYRSEAADVLRASAQLEVGVTTIDIGPSSTDVRTFDYDETGGIDTNPETGAAYDANIVDAADYYRAIAEYWADGPTSETPPGHWNSLANAVSDARDEIDRLRWDVQLGLVLNGALHDAAIAAWGNKAFYDSVRPISMIRWMAGQEGARSLPLEDGLVEVVTVGSSATGERHEGLPVGGVAIRTWLGSPEDAENEVSGVGWMLAIDWVPYQRATFVTPAFASYVSGHSVFSRAGAEVLSGFTGSDFFPGGLLSHEIEAGSFLHEDGPSEPITLAWATYRDAANEAGRSRIWGGIHIPSDDRAGRVVGQQVGQSALRHATELFDGVAL